MSRQKVRLPLPLLCIAAMVLGPVAPLFSQTGVSGRMAGRILDRRTQAPLEGVLVLAKRVTTTEVFESVATDARGSYSIADVPAGIYAFSLRHDGRDYEIEGRFDVRAGTSFLFESCFAVDLDRGTTALLPECSSGFYAESQVVALGAHRYFRTDPPALSDLGGQGMQMLTIDHDGRECFARDRYPQLQSAITPSPDVQYGRVFFRAAQHSDYYYVDMIDTGTGFEAILPKPSAETTEVVYYVEAMNLEFNPSQTQEYMPRVTFSDEECDDQPAGAYFTGGDPGIIVGSFVEGASTVPPGFLADGIASFITASGSMVSAGMAGAGGGSFITSSTGLILIVSGVGAATIVGVSSSNESEASPIQ